MSDGTGSHWKLTRLGQRATEFVGDLLNEPAAGEHFFFYPKDGLTMNLHRIRDVTATKTGQGKLLACTFKALDGTRYALRWEVE